MPTLQTSLATLAAVILLWAACASAQTPPSSVPPAPIPSQIFSAKRVFISNQPGVLYQNPSSTQDDPYRPYNQFYAAIKDWGHYELVDSPDDADLVLEISLSDRLVLSTARVQGESREAYFVLVFRDPKHQTTLWWLAERLPSATRVATGERNYDQAMTNLLADLRKLVSTPSTAQQNPKK